MISDDRTAPKITTMRVVPVAGHDSMLLNLSGAHGPYFTRNILILTDSAGGTGVGEVPGGEKIRQTLQESSELVIGQPINIVIQRIDAGGGANTALAHGPTQALLPAPGAANEFIAAAQHGS